jgi:hypothetical protein
VLALSGPALAQVNAEILRPNPFKPGFGAVFDGAFSVARGNVEVVDVGVSGRLQYQTLYPAAPAGPGEEEPLPFLRQRVFLTGSGRFAENADAPFISQTYLHARWTGMWHPRVGSDLFVQHQYNKFFRLKQRSLVGAGVRVEIVHERPVLVWGGSAYMMEFERIDVAPGASDRPETLDHRWTNHVTVRLSIYEGRLLLQNTVYYQPRFDDFGDFRVLEELEIVTRLSDYLGFGATLSVLHDGAPPETVKPTDLRLGTSVRLSL